MSRVCIVDENQNNLMLCAKTIRLDPRSGLIKLSTGKMLPIGLLVVKTRVCYKVL